MINQKKINSLLLLVILVIPMLISPNQYQYQVDGEVEEIFESTNNIPAIDPIPNDVNPSTKQSIIDYDTWYSGETIKTEIEFNKQSFDFVYTSHVVEENLINTKYVYPMYETFLLDYSYAFIDDVGYCNLGAHIDSPATANDWYTQLTVTVRIKADSDGTLAWGIAGRAIDNTANHYEISVPFETGIQSISTSDLDYEGWIYFTMFLGYDISVGADTLYLYLYLETPAGKTTLDSGSYTGGSTTNGANLIFLIDYLTFTRDTVTNHIKSEKKYSSTSSLISRLAIPSVPHAKELRIYTDLDFSSINPYATVTRVSNYWKIANPTELTYYIIFNLQTINYLPIADVSERLLVSNGFEDGQYATDWTNSEINPFETLTMETGIVYDGYYSLNLTQTSGTAGVLQNPIESGFYYVTANIYIQSISGGASDIYMQYNNGSWQQEYFDETILNRWQGISFYANISTAADNFGLRLDATTAIVYFDFSSLLFSHSATIANINSEEQLITIDYLNLDGYKNPNAVYINTTNQIRNSSTHSVIAEISKHTNEFGVFEWITNLNLVTDEYYIFSYANPTQEPVGQSNKFGLKSALNPIYPTPIRFSDSTNFIPNAVGTITQLTACGTTPNWNCVNDPVGSPDDDTTYVSMTVGTKKDTYNIPDHTTENGQISGVRVFIRCKKVVSTDDFRFVIRIGGSYYYWLITPTYAWATYNHIWTTEPSGGAWTWDDIDNLEIGVEEYASDGGPRCTQVYAVVTYTPDTTDPVISSPDDDIYMYESTGNNITWTITETNEDKYVIYQDDVEVESGSYTSGVDIVYDTDDLYIGVYNFTIFANDTSGNSATDLVWLTVWGVEIFYFFTPQSIPETPTLNVLDLSFYLSSANNTYSYDIHLDEKYNGIYTDLETILKNNTIGSHNLTYVFFSNSDDNLYLSSTYNYYYTIDPSAFSVNVESFYLSDLYINTYATSNYDYDYYLFEDNESEGDGVGFKEGTTITSDRNTTEAITIAYAIKFVYNSEIIWFNTSYSNSRSAFYVESYTVDIQEVNVEIVWTTTKSSIDSLTVYENTVLKVDGDEDSPSSWVKSTSVGIHYVNLIFDATDYGSIIYSFNYEIVLYVFEVNVESFYLSELYVNTYVTASDNGNYQVYENNTAIGSQGTLHYVGTSIQSDRNLTENAFLNYAIKFWNTDNDIIWFNTTYSNTEGDFFVSDYSVNIGDTTITITWVTSLPDYDKLTVKEDGATKVLEDTDSPSDWTKSTVVGTHSVVLLFQADGYTTITYSFNYHIYAVEDFRVDIGSFQVSDDYVNTYASANYDGDYYVYEDNIQIDTDTFYGAGTVIETSRNTTEGISIAYAIKFVYDSTEIWFNTSYSNPVTHFYLTDYRIEENTTAIKVIWNTTLMSLDSLTIYEDGSLKINDDPSSPTSWIKSTNVGNHYVTLIFSATGHDDIINSFTYIVSPVESFSVSVDTFYVTDDYINTYFTANRDGHYYVFENDTPIFDDVFLEYSPLTISTERDTTPEMIINYSIKYVNGTNIIWFNTTYQNAYIDFIIESYSVNISSTITIAWDTNKDSVDSLTVLEDGIEKVSSDTTSPSSWIKSTVVGIHHVTLIFSATNYLDIIYSFTYTVSESDVFTISVESYYLSDLYVNTYITSNRDGSYIVYEDSVPIDSGNFYKKGTTIITNRNVTPGASINYTIAFTYISEMIPFQAYYNNPSSDFFVTQYSIDIDATITVTWDTSKSAIDSLTIIEDGVTKETDDPSSPTTWTKSTEVGNHHVTLIFEATDYNDILFSFVYTVSADLVTEFTVNVQSFYMTDDYINLYCTSSLNYTYIAYTNETETGNGNGVATGTYIIIPKLKEAGLWNFTLVFTNSSDTVIFMTWYSNLIPPLHPLNDLYREQSTGFFNLTFHSNLESYWIDIFHDDSLIVDDSTLTFFAIQKTTLVGWHNVTVHYIYNVSTDSEGYPVAEYNITLVYEFWYEVKFFYDVRIRYIPDDIGLAIGEFNVNWVKTYFDGELVVSGDIDDVAEYSNYTFISNYDIRIKNTLASHSLVVKDLFDRTILTRTIDISSFAYQVIELPIYRLGVVNLDNATHKFAVKPWQTEEAWEMSPILPQGAFIEFWFCYGIYIFRIYSIGTTYYKDGVLIELWDDYENLPPGRLPLVITIPLALEGPTPPDELQWYEELIYQVLMGVGAAILIIVVIAIWRARRKKRKANRSRR